MTACVICQEAEGIDTPLAFQDDLVVAFPARWQPAEHRGCTLVVSRFHVNTLYDLTDDIIGPFMQRLRDIAQAVQLASGANGTTIMQNNNPPGQELDHLHLHVIPRFLGDDYWNTTACEVHPEDRQLQAESLRAAIAERRKSR